VSRFDRYLLSQLLALFGFFSLVLVAIYWVNRAVSLFDQLMSDGQTALVFLEFTLLTLPNVIKLVLPISAFVAALYAGNRLMQDSEFVVMQATGFSSARLARPVLYFGMIAAVMMLVLTNWLVPLSRTEMRARSAEMAENITSQFLRDGEFMHPAKGVTLYIRAITPQGELKDFLLEDARRPERPTLYLAHSAVLVRGDAGPKLLLVDGQAQEIDRTTGRLAVTRFEDFTVDIGGMLTRSVSRSGNVDELSTLQLIRADEASQELTGMKPAQLQLEGHNRLAQPFLAAAAALAGFSCLLVGSFSRFGPWRQILGAVFLGIVVQLVNTWSNAWAGIAEGRWPMAYAAPILGLVLSGLLIWWSQQPRRIPSGARVAAA